MLRRLLVDSSIYTLAAAVPGIAGVLLLPVYTRHLRAEDYGIVDLITLTFTIVNVVATLEVAQGLARHLPEAADRDARRRISSTAFWFTAATMLAAAALVALAATQLAPAIAADTRTPSLLRIGAATALLGALHGIASRQLRWALRPRAFLVVTIVATLITAIATLALLIRFAFGPAALLVGQAAGSAVGLAVAWLLARDEIGFTWDAAAARQMLSFSTPLVASTLGVLAAGQASRWIVAHAGSLEATGLFGVGSRVASILGFAASGLQLSLAPLIYATHRDARTPEDLAASFRLFVVAAAVLWGGLALFAREITALLAAPAFHAAAPLIAPLGAASLLTTATMFAPGLEIRHRTGVVAGVSLLCGAVNLSVGWWAVGRFGVAGAAAAMCGSAALQALLIFTLSQRHYPVPHRWVSLLLALLIAGAAAQAANVDAITARAGVLVGLALACWLLLLRRAPIRS